MDHNELAGGKRIVIVGGVAAGASAAARARRISEKAKIVLFERGKFISFANCGLPYHIGETITDRDELLIQTPEAMFDRYRIDVRVRTEILRIDRERKMVLARNLNEGREYWEPYDALILCPGAKPIRPPFEGLESRRIFTLRSIEDMDAIKAFIDGGKAKSAVIVGGGYIGLEMAEALRNRNLDTTIVQRASQVMSPADPEMVAPLHQHLKQKGVGLRLAAAVKGFADRGDSLDVRLESGETISCDMAILAVGVKPESRLAREAGLAIGECGGILVDDSLRTSDPDIFAAGDAIEVVDFVGAHQILVPLAGPANRQGRIAADNALGRSSTYKKTQGTAIVKVFDLTLGMTGLTEKALKRLGLPYEKIYIHPFSHAAYYPGAEQLSLKLTFDPKTGRVLGAQAVGAEGVDKRIDVLAVAIRARLTVFDLEDLELSYAPPYGSAKDPVNYAGFVAANVLRGDVALGHADEAAKASGDGALLDVRTQEEFQAGTIPGALNVPVDELRERLAELPRDKEMLVFCGVGLRGYVACRILSQNGFKCRNLSGGIKTYRAATAGGGKP